ncbi:thiamine pyrophosphate-binding protein [Mycobacterium avium]|uniref:thiamine pyrophosphate-binding protein n=3 Tax=Mycobacterium avium TaxID=1764 RepID=UPI00293B89D9|nr:thiamine pyrophosphate-binding protein [Mycobacterium avium]
MVETLHAYGVRYVFGVPGAKIDPVFDALLDSGAELVVCRHEQNAAHAMWDPSTSLCARLGSWRSRPVEWCKSGRVSACGSVVATMP